MATDTLKQASKNLKRTKDRTEFTVNRAHKNFPLIERLRDSFGTTHPFNMEFQTYGADDSVHATFIFKEIFEYTC